MALDLLGEGEQVEMGKTYDICMYTLLGKKYGKMFAQISRQKLDGWLEIMNHREAFEGVIDENGNCKISGVFVTLIHSVPYTAAGIISDDTVSLKLWDSRNTFELSGTAVESELEDN